MFSFCEGGTVIGAQLQMSLSFYILIIAIVLIGAFTSGAASMHYWMTKGKK